MALAAALRRTSGGVEEASDAMTVRSLFLPRTPVLGLLVVAAVGSAARGATVPAASAPAPGSATPPVFTVETEVTATAVSEEREDVPATVRVVGSAETEARQAESIVELLGTVPGAHAFVAGPPGQQASLFLRGADSNQTLVLWNGIPLNDPYFGDVNFAFLPTDGLERLEVVAGPFSALYGSSAVGGVVQVITAPQAGTDLLLEVGQTQHRRATLAASGTRGSLNGWVSGHWRDGEGGLDNDAYESRELAGQLRWGSGSTTAALLARWNDSNTGIPLGFTATGFAPTPHQHIAWEERQWGIPWSHTIDGWELRGTLSQVHYDNAYRYPEDPFGFTRSDTTSSADRVRAAGTRPLGSGSSALGWWSAGAEWERLGASNDGSFGPTLDDSRQRTRAVFTQLHLEGGRWAADLGLRRDDNDAYGGATSPRLGAVVALAPWLRLRASHGESFRAPSLGELFFPGTGNPDLQPERGRSTEVGAELSRGPWRLDLVAFANRQRDLIDLDFTTFRNVNVGQAKSHGTEAELRFERGLFTARLGLTRLHTENRDTGEALLRRPERSAHLVALVRPGRASLSLVGTWVGSRLDLDPATFAHVDNASYFTLDVAGGWQLRSHIAPFARVLNVLDRRHQPVLGFPALGRTVVGGVRVEW